MVDRPNSWLMTARIGETCVDANLMGAEGVPHEPLPDRADRDSDRVQSLVAPSGWLQSRAVARFFGVKTDTLKHWRAQGKGPQGWRRVSPTVVMYPVSEVKKFHEQWSQSITN